MTSIREEVRQLCESFPVPAAASSRQLDRLSGSGASVQQHSNQQTATWPQPTHRILIADDNAANRELLEAYLVGVDCEIETSVDGQDTLDKVASFQPDLVLLDVMMPRLSGFEVCEKLKDG